MRPDIVLAFDTSAAHCAAALLSGERVLDLVHEDMATGQAERLMPMLQAMLARQNLAWHDLSVIGVGTGPGNFTGVRIGVAAARGLAMGLNIPAVGVNIFEALALDAPRPTVVRLDARRDQVYLQVFDGSGGAARLTDPQDDQVPQGAGFLGLDAETLAARHGGRALQAAHPLPVAIARIAMVRRKAGQRPAPFYLRGPDAAPPSDPPPVMLG